MARFVAPSATSSRTFRAVALALKLIPREVRNDINRTTRAVANPMWREAVNARAVTPTDKKVLAKGARVAPGNPLTFIAASSRRPLSGGLVPDAQARVFEFGTADREKVTEYDRSGRRSQAHKVKRHTRRQLPRYTDKGRVIYQAAADVAPRITSLWVQTIVRRIYEAHEKGQ